MTGRHKRRGSDPITANTVAVSSSPIHFNDHDNNNSTSSSSSSSSSWFHSTLQRLEQLRIQLESDDEANDEKKILADTIYDGQSMSDADIRMAEQELVQVADAYTSQLQQRLAKEQMTLKQESEELYQQRLLVQQLQSERDELVDDINHLEDSSRMLRQQIHQYQEDFQQTQEGIDRIEEEESRRLLRLQYEIGLYAAATGLKWYGSDLEGVEDCSDKNQRLLRGDVAVPSQQRIRRFSFDLDKEVPFAIANKLWSMMSGDDDCFSSLLVSA